VLSSTILSLHSSPPPSLSLLGPLFWIYSCFPLAEVAAEQEIFIIKIPMYCKSFVREEEMEIAGVFLILFCKLQAFCQIKIVCVVFYQEFQISRILFLWVRIPNYPRDVTVTLRGNDNTVVGDSKTLVWTTKMFAK
jgi:hypothetical protein